MSFRIFCFARRTLDLIFPDFSAHRQHGGFPPYIMNFSISPQFPWEAGMFDRSESCRAAILFSCEIRVQFNLAYRIIIFFGNITRQPKITETRINKEPLFIRVF